MSVAVQAKPADPTDELTQLADEVGVLLEAVLREKTSANAVVVVEGSTVEKSTPASRVLKFVKTIQAWARQAVKAVRDALAFIVEPARVIAEYVRNKRESGDYAGRHRTQVAWYGVQRSTASRVAVQRRRQAGRQPADSEPALPEYFVSYIALAVEAMRGHEDALHPRAGYQFRC